MAFPDLSTVNATADLGELLVYTNTITGNWAMPMVLLAFFLIIFLGGLFYQARKGTTRPEILLSVAGFLTFGMSMIMSLKEGLLNPIYVFMSIGVSVLGVVWMFLSSD